VRRAGPVGEQRGPRAGRSAVGPAGSGRLGGAAGAEEVEDEGGGPGVVVAAGRGAVEGVEELAEPGLADEPHGGSVEQVGDDGEPVGEGPVPDEPVGADPGGAAPVAGAVEGGGLDVAGGDGVSGGAGEPGGQQQVDEVPHDGGRQVGAEERPGRPDGDDGEEAAGAEARAAG